MTEIELIATALKAFAKAAPNARLSAEHDEIFVQGAPASLPSSEAWMVEDAGFEWSSEHRAWRKGL